MLLSRKSDDLCGNAVPRLDQAKVLRGKGSSGSSDDADVRGGPLGEADDDADLPNAAYGVGAPPAASVETAILEELVGVGELGTGVRSGVLVPNVKGEKGEHDGLGGHDLESVDLGEKLWKELFTN